MYDPDALSTNWSSAPGERELPQGDRVPRGEARHLNSPRVGHFALDTAADEIAGLVRGFVKKTD